MDGVSKTRKVDLFWRTHHLVLASSALETENNLLGSLGLLVEDRLSLSSVTCLSEEFTRDEFEDPDQSLFLPNFLDPQKEAG